MSAKIINLDNFITPSVYCPVCGKIVESCELVKIDVCEHVLFSLSSADDVSFNHVAPSCKKITDRAMEAHEAFGIDAFSYAVEQLHSKSILCFSVQLLANVRMFYVFAFGPIHLEEE